MINCVCYGVHHPIVIREPQRKTKLVTRIHNDPTLTQCFIFTIKYTKLFTNLDSEYNLNYLHYILPDYSSATKLALYKVEFS